MKIQNKLLLFAFLSCILPLLFAFVITFNAAQKSLTTSVEQSLLVEAKEQLSELQEKLASSKQELVTLSKMGSMQNVLLNDYGGRLQRDIDLFSTRSPLFSEIAATDHKGTVLASSLHDYIQTDVSGTWEYEAPRLGIHFDGRVVHSYRLKKPIATHSVPVFNRKIPDQIIGVLIGAINWKHLQNNLASRSLFGGEQSKQRQFILESLKDNSILYSTHGIDVPHDLLASVTTSGEVRKVANKGLDYISLSVDSTPVDGFRDPMWRLHVLLDTDIAYASVKDLKTYFCLTAAAVILLAVGLGLILARSIVNPVNSLAADAKRIAKGDYDHVLDAGSSRDEIGQLTHSFNAMRIAVRHNQKELEAKTVLAEQAAKVKGEFLANMSHEVRTPINGVLGMTELIMNTPLDEKQDRFAKSIFRSGQALLAVINDILDFSKFEAGKLELNLSSFDLRELVEDIVEMLAENAARKNVELTLVMEPGLPNAFNGDSARLRQILLNLLSNAIKFTSEGEVKLLVSMADTDQESVAVKFRVIDTGIGISEENQKNIFGSFVQADGSTTRQYGGTGLGLTISSNLVGLMGGAIDVISAHGKGSEFTFEINLEQLPSDVSVQWQQSDSLSGKRALIVDDNLTNREILDLQLDYWGIETVVVSSGAQALQMLVVASETKSPFDLAILDMHMPQMSGIELATQIKQDRLATDTKLLMLSSACDNLKPEDCQELNIEALVAKPVRQVELFNVLIATCRPQKPVPLTGNGVPAAIVQNDACGHILLVEDNPVNQDMMCEMLRVLGHTVEVAEDGQKAIESLESGKFDTVLMDCQMPVLDGFAATRKIRNAEAQNETGFRQPIIALTANAMEGDREKCISSGMDDYLTKPVSAERLRAILELWLPSPEQSQQSGTADDKHLASAADSPRLSSNVLDDNIFSGVLSMCEQAPPGFYSNLVNKFDVSSAEDISSIKEGVESADAEMVSAAAHRLKSSSLSIGGQALSERCQELETAAKSGFLDDGATLCLLIEEEQALLMSALRLQEVKAA